MRQNGRRSQFECLESHVRNIGKVLTWNACSASIYFDVCSAQRGMSSVDMACSAAHGGLRRRLILGGPMADIIYLSNLFPVLC